MRRHRNIWETIRVKRTSFFHLSSISKSDWFSRKWRLKEEIFSPPKLNCLLFPFSFLFQRQKERERERGWSSPVDSKEWNEWVDRQSEWEKKGRRGGGIHGSVHIWWLILLENGREKEERKEDHEVTDWDHCPQWNLHRGRREIIVMTRRKKEKKNRNVRVKSN